jgi:hypothetical protein
MVRSFFDPRKKAAMMARVKKGQPPPQFVDPFAKEKDKVEGAVPIETVEALEKARLMKQKAVSDAIHKVYGALQVEEDEREKKWLERGERIVMGVSAALGVSAFTTLLVTHPITQEGVAMALAVAVISSIAAYILQSLTVPRIIMKRNHKKSETACSVLNQLKNGAPASNITDDTLREMAKDPEMRKHLESIAAAGSDEAEGLINRMDTLLSHANESYPIEW